MIDFLATELEDFPGWQRLQPDRNEDYYNQNLDRFLQVRARVSLDAVQFGREARQETSGRHDISAFPSEEAGLVVRSRVFGPREPIYTMECKRLPTPGTKREREYLTSEAGERPQGAVQRYKMGIHGGGLDDAGIIGYVQEGVPEVWRKTINGWVEQLIRKPVDISVVWKRSERLKLHPSFKHGRRVLVSKSESGRLRGGTIRIAHFFVNMKLQTQSEFSLTS